MEHYLKPARTAGGTLVKPGTLVEPLEEIGGTLVEPSSGARRGWWNPGGNLVEPSWNLTSNHPAALVETTQTTPQPGTLVEPWRNPRETFLKPAALEEIGTLVEPSWNLTSNHPKPPQTTLPLQNLVEPWWNPGGTLVEPWWNPGGTLVEPW